MEIKIYGDKELRKKAALISNITSDIKSLASEMTEMMHQKDGVGLAAPQVGISKKLIVIDYKPDAEKLSNPITFGESYLIPLMPVALINPEIISSSKETIVYEEGCLSMPQIYANVERPKKVIIKAKLLNDEEIYFECGGLLSIIIQHEIDHLDGILFIDRVKSKDLSKIQKKLDKLKNTKL
ncbi:MAG: peptide deformylase [Lentisphaerae bacterium GWF2_38_69]|nr:MAG: peptide deformylase [Lentisphaerae bacterium GWF2_38_69]